MILSEAKQLAKEYMVTEEEVNEYLLAGFSYDACKVFCDMRACGWKHSDVMNAISVASAETWNKRAERWRARC